MHSEFHSLEPTTENNVSHCKINRGVDLSQKLGRGKPKYWGKTVVITDENMGVSQVLGARPGYTLKYTPMIVDSSSLITVGSNGRGLSMLYA